MRPKTDGILESALYVSDIARSVRFYQETFGFSVIIDFGPPCVPVRIRYCCSSKKEAHAKITSPHDGDGKLRLAFAISAAELANWESWLARKGIHVEEKRAWELGGTSLYFRDPDHHLLELATSGVWTVY
ncbi:MAG TPA: VOC family protein [Candidatus Acidoferrum sp.]|nr:VOC family protein [Candidatus Acidoferrum sp.]